MRNQLYILLVILLLGVTSATGQEFRPKKAELVTSKLPSLIPYREGELWGYADSSGAIKIKPKFKGAEPFKNQVAKVLDGGWKLMDRNGNMLTSRGYPTLYPIVEGELYMVNNADRKYGVVNNKGEEIIPVVYNYIALEYITQTGQMALKVNLETELSQAEKMNRSRSARDNRLFGLYDEHGKRLLPAEYAEIHHMGEGYFRACKADGCIIISYTGEILPTPKGMQASWYKDGMISVSKDFKHHGFADKTGKLVIPADFEHTRYFTEGLAAAEENNKWGFIDKTGKWIIKPVYDQADEFKGGLAIARKGNLYGLVDKKGKELTEFIYQRILYNQGSDYFNLYQDKGGITAFYKAKTGELVFTDKYHMSDGFKDGLAKVSGATNKYGYINEKNQLAIPLEFSEAHSFRDGLAIVRKDTGHGVIDKEGKTVLPFVFYELTMINPDLFMVRLQSGSRGMILYGLMNSKGEEVLPPVYTRIQYFESDYTTIEHYQGVGVINNKGKVVVPVVKFPPGYHICGGWSEGIVKVCSYEKNREGYLDRYGRAYFSDK